MNKRQKKKKNKRTLVSIVQKINEFINTSTYNFGEGVDVDRYVEDLNKSVLHTRRLHAVKVNLKDESDPEIYIVPWESPPPRIIVDILSTERGSLPILKSNARMMDLVIEGTRDPSLAEIDDVVSCNEENFTDLIAKVPDLVESVKDIPDDTIKTCLEEAWKIARK